MAIVNHIKGDTFQFDFVISQGDTPEDLTSWSIASHLRESDTTLVQVLTVTVTSAASGEFSVSATASEAEAWPTGLLKTDVNSRNLTAR